MEGFENKDYVVDKVLRKRPLGNVYKARRVSDGVLCAIKELDVRHMSEEEREDALEEIRVLTTVRNENVISYYDAFRGDNRLFIVMEYCDEPDLGRHIKTRAEHQKFFSEAQIWSYFIQMLRGLVAVHSRGLIHRDMRSGNIIQLDSHAVKVGDVRVGRVLNEGPAATDIGNPQFVPPEVWQNKAYTFKSDVWAAGCVLYEMITLAVPFGGCSLPDMRAKVVEGTYQPIPTAFSTGLSNVLKLLLNPDQATRISARDMLLHPVVQAHLHHAPAPAPMLRVRGSQDQKNLASISALSSMPVDLKSSYPTLVVTVDKKELPGQTVESKQVADSPGTRHQSGLSSEKPTTPAVRSRVAPILAPRAILSSRDNDEMLADVNRPANQVSKGKLPRVAMLGKVIPKSPIETSPATPQGPPSTPRVNMKHFKTAYILSPKVDPDEFQALNDRSDVSSLKSASGTLKSKSLATPPKSATPGREKSSDSVRSAGSSRSDDSSIRVRAPIDTLDHNHTESATPRRENSVDSAKSVASSRSGDSLIRVRAPVDFSVAPHANGVPQKADSLTTVTSSASAHSNGSVFSVRATITELDEAQPMVVPDDLPTSLAGDGVVTPEAPELVTPGRVDGPEPSQRLDESDSVRRDALESLAQTSRASRAKPVTSQPKATTPTRNAQGGRDGVARKSSVPNASGLKASGDASDKRLPNARNRRLSFDGGIRNEKPLTSSKSFSSKREISSGVPKLGAGSRLGTKGPADSRAPAKPQTNGTEPSQSRRPASSNGPQQPSSVGTRKKSQNGDISTPRANGKDAKVPGCNTTDSSKSSSATVQARKKIVSPIIQGGKQRDNSGSGGGSKTSSVKPIDQGGKQGDNFVTSGRNSGAVKAQSPQTPIRSRRLSLDVATKG
ncbi:unnamed protein product [Calypogeia fissa]